MSNDYVAISNLVFRYAELLDSGDSDGVGELFADGEFSSAQLGGPYRGREAVAAHFRDKAKLFDDGLPWAKHITTNLMIEIADAGTSAICRSVFTGFQEVPGTQQIILLGVGRYFDDFAKSKGAWHFTRRRLVRDLTGDMSSYQ